MFNILKKKEKEKRSMYETAIHFFPELISGYLIVILILLGIILIVSSMPEFVSHKLGYEFDAPLEPEANPYSTPSPALPDWYFLALFWILRAMPTIIWHYPWITWKSVSEEEVVKVNLFGSDIPIGESEFLGAVVIPSVFFGIVFLVPFLDRSPNREIRKRKFWITIGTIVVILFFTLTVLAGIGIWWADIMKWIWGGPPL